MLFDNSLDKLKEINGSDDTTLEQGYADDLVAAFQYEENEDSISIVEK